MDLTIYDIVRGPVITDKAYKLNSKLNQLVILVHPHANKVLVREALEKLFDVKVECVRIIVRKGKRRVGSNKRQIVTGALQKKAIVTLKEGYSIDALGQQGFDAAVPSEKASEASVQGQE
jgi:large subunit ribosomal protein L23